MPGLEIARQIDVHQAVGGADLDFRIGVVRRPDQRIHGLRAPDVIQRLHRFDAHAQIGIAHEGSEFRESRPRLACRVVNRARALFGIVLEP